MSGGSSYPPRKVRRLSGYNCWHRQFLQSAEGKSLDTLSEKNKVSGCKWRELTDEERQKYKEMAQNEEATSSASTASNKKEIRRALSSLTNIAEHMKQLDCEVMYTVIQKNDHYCGGTEKGMNYLQNETPWLPYSFMGALAKPDGFKNKKAHPRNDTSLRVKVEELFNRLYGVAVEKPNVRLPYSKIKEYGISAEGLPDDKDLKHPSSYGKNMLKAILDKSELITIKVQHPPESPVTARKKQSSTSTSELPPSASMFLSSIASNAIVDLSPQVCLPSCSSRYVSPAEESSARIVKPQSTNPFHHDHTYVHVNDKPQPTSKQRIVAASRRQPSEVVTLYNKHGQPVGCGKIVLEDANFVHGHQTRKDCVKVVIDYIQPGTNPPYPSAFDEDEPLMAGQFTMWPKDRIRHAN